MLSEVEAAMRDGPRTAAERGRAAAAERPLRAVADGR
jgi:hypothetical protein